MSRPLIGITGYVEPARWSVWNVATSLIPHSYVVAVRRAGGRPVILPPDDLDAGVIHRLDGLIFAGGADIGPRIYGEPPHPATVCRPDRDTAELMLLRAGLSADIPILGVCRGIQVLAVAYGGRLHQHLPDVLGHDGHCSTPGVLASHRARFAAGSTTAAILGETLDVNSHHHQGVADPGRLTPTGWADDGLIEAVEDMSRRFVLGVQWHPEESQGRDADLFGALVNACDASQAARREAGSSLVSAQSES